MKRRVWRRRKDGVKQRYHVGRKPKKRKARSAAKELETYIYSLDPRYTRIAGRRIARRPRRHPGKKKAQEILESGEPLTYINTGDGPKTQAQQIFADKYREQKQQQEKIIMGAMKEQQGINTIAANPIKPSLTQKLKDELAYAEDMINVEGLPQDRVDYFKNQVDKIKKRIEEGAQ